MPDIVDLESGEYYFEQVKSKRVCSQKIIWCHALIIMAILVTITVSLLYLEFTDLGSVDVLCYKFMHATITSDRDATKFKISPRATIHILRPSSPSQSPIPPFPPSSVHSPTADLQDYTTKTITVAICKWNQMLRHLHTLTYLLNSTSNT